MVFSEFSEQNTAFSEHLLRLLEVVDLFLKQYHQQINTLILITNYHFTGIIKMNLQCKNAEMCE